ncbi:hypothetical protein D9M71_371060 [compost metagenome]
MAGHTEKQGIEQRGPAVMIGDESRGHGDRQADHQPGAEGLQAGQQLPGSADGGGAGRVFDHGESLVHDRLRPAVSRVVGFHSVGACSKHGSVRSMTTQGCAEAHHRCRFGMAPAGCARVPALTANRPGIAATSEYSADPQPLQK